MRDTLHQAAVTGEDIGVMIDNLLTGAVELGRKHLFCNRHTDRIRQALSQRPRSRLDSGGETILGMSRCL